MEHILARFAGLDVHKESVEACVRRIEANGRVHSETRHWGTMTRDLLEMADWLEAEGVTDVAMESTGVFWKPIFNILESRFVVLLVNARHLKQVPGRKGDVRDKPRTKSSKSRDSWNIPCDLCFSLDQLDVLPLAQLLPGSAISAHCFRRGCSADRTGRRQVVHDRNDCFGFRRSPRQLSDRTESSLCQCLATATSSPLPVTSRAPSIRLAAL